jgi:sterol desaturase/sphingolipid hydroxylase (fatty acid hydroxylase superfamily)
MSIVLGVVFGWIVWTFAEYTLHRFAFHEARGRNYGSREHLRHHANPVYHLWSNWPAWLGVLAVGFGLWRWVFGDVVGLSQGTAWAIGTGWVVGYFHYEWLHMACHLWPSRTAYGAFVRRHHFHHHFGAPLRNHGVSSPFWDHVFGTYDHVDRVIVPRRLAFRWLLDESGEVKPEHRATYEVRGRKPLVKHEELEVAFANEAPALV